MSDIKVPLSQSQSQNIHTFIDQKKMAEAQVELLISTILDCHGYGGKDYKVSVTKKELILTPMGGDPSSGSVLADKSISDITPKE